MAETRPQLPQLWDWKNPVQAVQWGHGGPERVSSRLSTTQVVRWRDRTSPEQCARAVWGHCALLLPQEATHGADFPSFGGMEGISSSC